MAYRRTDELCCNFQVKTDQHDQIRVNLSHINMKHILTIHAFIRLYIELYGPTDIVNEISYYYAKPIIMNIQYERSIKYILYCPIDDNWNTITKKLKHQFSMKKQRYNPLDEFSMKKQRSRYNPLDELKYYGKETIRFTSKKWNNTFEWDQDKIFEAIFEDDYIKRSFPEMVDDSSDESESYSSYSSSSEFDDYIPSLKDKLKNFDKIAATGQLFWVYIGVRRRSPKDRIIKVSFDNKYRAKQISWGTGSRHINFVDILYISWGHWSPVFDARKNDLDPWLCFSVVGKEKVLDLQSESKDMTELWVKGLRKLIGQSDEMADKLAKQGLHSLLTRTKQEKEKKSNIEKRNMMNRNVNRNVNNGNVQQYGTQNVNINVNVNGNKGNIGPIDVNIQPMNQIDHNNDECLIM